MRAPRGKSPGGKHHRCTTRGRRCGVREGAARRRQSTTTPSAPGAPARGTRLVVGEVRVAPLHPREVRRRELRLQRHHRLRRRPRGVRAGARQAQHQRNVRHIPGRRPGGERRFSCAGEGSGWARGPWIRGGGVRACCGSPPCLSRNNNRGPAGRARPGGPGRWTTRSSWRRGRRLRAGFAGLPFTVRVACGKEVI